MLSLPPCNTFSILQLALLFFHIKYSTSLSIVIAPQSQAMFSFKAQPFSLKSAAFSQREVEWSDFQGPFYTTQRLLTLTPEATITRAALKETADLSIQPFTPVVKLLLFFLHRFLRTHIHHLQGNKNISICYVR